MMGSTGNTTQRSSKRLRAFASFSAVVLVGTTALALTALTRVTTTEMRFTNDAATDAQLRQLLLAGQAFLDAQSTKPNGADRIEVALPEPLQSTSALTIIFQRKGAEGTPIATIQASHHQRQATSELVLKGNGRWRSRDVTMP